ncbi:hypothetical protein EMIHUDRAFT_106350 [Emiliania huxleyi CCMP1516]|uniref:EamA domain-containing protein n=2 Tax=Emiliania huxleyi TaxID=2903 RepID=A0A0D3I9S0_EMIH1|nr:hypothetical protein EMIHUDRAFT_106350 [Emiliania huxleyi CCMP1516]EOD08005.1 hypothetical protein EMIHUDRAFT_106350 [Emiliania huxleyi CCMP1516]|eukprot:XP_005760434.1 hypothetical protein EMIHUDRAFT_106350 [Emiliania huxleyi CCMP1516]
MCNNRVRLEPLLPPEQKAHSRQHYVGLAYNTAATLTFGLVSVLVKLAGLPTPLMLQVRSLTQWSMALVAVALRLRRVRQQSPPAPSLPIAISSPSPPPSAADLLFAPAGHRVLLVLRSLMYWAFMMLWWAALVHMPPGDAVAIVYLNPILTAIFASILLSEPINAAVPYCCVLATAGVALIVRPSFLFGGAPVTPAYATGLSLAFGSAVMAGLLPLAVRKSKDVHWSTVEHITAILASFVFTPVFLISWLATPGSGEGTVPDKLGRLLEPGGLLCSWRSALVVLIAGIGFFGLAMQTSGYQKVESTATAAVMAYLEVPFVFLLQSLFFGEAADAVKLLGVTLLVASGVLNLWHGEIARIVGGRRRAEFN